MITDQIIDRCQKGDRGAQQLIYQELSATMFGVTLRYAPNRSMAEDWLHDGFIHLFDSIGSYRGQGSFVGWARRVFVTTALGHLRIKSTRMSIEHGANGDLSLVESSMATAIETMESEDILNAIARLPTLQRTVLNMFSIEGFSHEEIATILHISPQNSRTILHRAKVELSHALSRTDIIE
ncbi:MAG: sigma-70 family RNA polymerase sigma factor [Mucinivorans sp.]